ncbi:MAG: NAD-dependent epimerase/dehydratase family protein [Bryobacteraceae bacterium]|jgi:nucleoside-diphosphate-sugar epimerase
MRAFVTGASGFLGGRLAQVLASRAESVRVLARPSNNLSHLANLRVEVVEGTLADEPILASALEGITHVFHCAAASTDWAPWSTYLNANVAGTRNLLKAATTAAELERFLHVSTTDVYGYPKQVCDESSPPVDVGLPYNRTKILGERAALDSGLPVTVVRPATIYGPRSVTFGTDLAKLLRQRLMAVIDHGQAPGGFLYVDNAVDAILRAATAQESLGRVYNLSDGTGVTWKTFVDRLADGLGYPRPWIDIPTGGAFALARFLEAMPGRPLLTRHAVHLLARDQEFPIDRIRRELGYAPAVGFEEGMARTVQWLKTRT